MGDANYKEFMKNIKRATIGLFLLFSFQLAHSQRINTGFSMDLYGINITRFSSDVIFSETSYKGYYVKRLQAPGSMQTNYGGNILIDYSRFFVVTRFDINSPIKGVIYKLSYPISGNKFEDFYSRIQYQRSEISASFAYYIKVQKFFRPFLEAGLGRSMLYFYREDFSDDKSFKTLWTGRQEIRDLMRLDKPYNYLIIGYGFRGDMFSFYSRYNIRLENKDVFFSNLSFGIAVYTKFSKIRKHYIYQPED
jgi:hypothetical protein